MNASFSFPKSNTQRKLLNIKNTCVYHTPETRYMPNSSILWHTCVHIHRHVDYSSHHLRLYITLNLSAYVTKSFSIIFYRNNKVILRVDYLQKCLIISSNWFKWQYILFRSSLGEHQNFSNGRQNATVLIHLQLKLFVVCVCMYVCMYVYTNVCMCIYVVRSTFMTRYNKLQLCVLAARMDTDIGGASRK